MGDVGRVGWDMLGLADGCLRVEGEGEGWDRQEGSRRIGRGEEERKKERKTERKRREW